MPGKKHIAIVANPAAAHNRALTISNEIMQILAVKNIEHTFYLEDWPRSFPGFTDVWIVGGDGTVNYFINNYPEIDIPLAIFPGGSGNDMQWLLYGNRTVEEQVDFVLQAAPRKIDAGICNGKLFLNGVGIGFDGAVVKDLLGKKLLAGKSSYLLSILKHIVGYTEKLCSLDFGEVISQPCFMISVANGQRYGGGFLVAPRASVTDGLLDINIVGKISPLKRIKYLPVIEKGKHLDLPFIKYKQAEKVTIRSEMPLHAHLDGEYIQASEFEITCLPIRFSFLW
jgi:diacylglycerol kinase (ATP)